MTPTLLNMKFLALFFVLILVALAVAENPTDNSKVEKEYIAKAMEVAKKFGRPGHRHALRRRGRRIIWYRRFLRYWRRSSWKRREDGHRFSRKGTEDGHRLCWRHGGWPLKNMEDNEESRKKVTSTGTQTLDLRLQ